MKFDIYFIGQTMTVEGNYIDKEQEEFFVCEITCNGYDAEFLLTSSLENDLMQVICAQADLEILQAKYDQPKYWEE